MIIFPIKNDHLFAQCNHCIFPLSHFNPTTIVGQSRSYREKKLPMKNLQPQRKKIAYA